MFFQPHKHRIAVLLLRVGYEEHDNLAVLKLPRLLFRYNKYVSTASMLLMGL